MSILEKSQEQQNSILTVANNVQGMNIAASSAVQQKVDLSADAAPVNTQDLAGKAVDSGKDAQAKIAAVGDIRTALANQLPDGNGGEQKKSALASESAAPGYNDAIRNLTKGGMLALGIAIPVVGAAMAVKEAADFVMKPVPGVNEHAGLKHAVLNPGQSEFKSVSISEQGKGSKGQDPITSSYTDTSGDTYENGFKANKQGPTQMKTPSGIPLDLQIDMAASKAAAEMGPDKIRKDLAGVTSVEQRLQQQQAAASEQLESLGQKGASLALQVKPPQPGIQGPGFGGPRIG